eukprot:248493-Hanusia_phi.AAC.1
MRRREPSVHPGAWRRRGHCRGYGRSPGRPPATARRMSGADKPGIRRREPSVHPGAWRRRGHRRRH